MNEQLNLKVGDWLSIGWKTFKKYPYPIICGAIIMMIGDLLWHMPFPWGFISGFFVVFIFLPVIYVGLCHLCLKAVRGERPSVVDIFSGFSRFPTAWATFFLYSLIMLCGVILLIVPGIIWSIMFSMSPYAILEKKVNPIQTLRFSSRITSGHRNKLFVLFLLFFIFGAFELPFLMLKWNMADGVTSFNLLVVIEVILYLIVCLVIFPWSVMSEAVAYNNLTLLMDSKAADSAPVPLT